MQEALRLQKLRKAKLSAADFGEDDLADEPPGLSATARPPDRKPQRQRLRCLYRTGGGCIRALRVRLCGDCVGSEVTRAAASNKKGAAKAKAKTKDKQVLCHHIDCPRTHAARSPQCTRMCKRRSAHLGRASAVAAAQGAVGGA